ncbi:hypothetical protein ABFS83_12G049900 [Erythranthe nasuta]
MSLHLFPFRTILLLATTTAPTPTTTTASTPTGTTAPTSPPPVPYLYLWLNLNHIKDQQSPLPPRSQSISLQVGRLSNFRLGLCLKNEAMMKLMVHCNVKGFEVEDSILLPFLLCLGNYLFHSQVLCLQLRFLSF